MAVQFLNATPGFADNAPAGAAKINANFAELYGNVRAAVKMFTFASVAAMVAAPYLQAGDTVLTQGYFAPGDGGTGLYRIVAPFTGAVDGGMFIDLVGSTGQAAIIVLDTIEAAWYGLDTTGVTACDVKINFAIQVAISAKKKLVLPGGVLLLNLPLMCFKPGSVFAALYMEGQGSGVPGQNLAGSPSPIYGPNTLLCMNSKVMPAVIYQAGRHCVLKNLGIQGLNAQAFSGNVPSPPTDNRSDYITAGCLTGFQSPYCGIAIDPFPSTPPPDGGYATLSAYYGSLPSGSGSSDMLFENILISEFVVGIANSAASVSQGDDMTFKNIHFYYSETGYVGGNSQARNCWLDKCEFYYLRQAIDTINYGNPVGTGVPPIAIRDCQFVQMYRLFALSAGGSCDISGCYAESFKTMGQSGTSSGFAGISFEGNQFEIRDGWGSLPHYVFESSNTCVFKGCRFGSDLGSRDVWNFYGVNAPIGLEQCTFTGSPYTDLPPYFGVDLNSQHPVRMVDCWMRSAAGGQFLISDDYQRAYSILNNANGKGRLRATFQTRWVSDSNNTQYAYKPAQTTPNINITTAANITIVGNTLTFTESTLGELQVNDVLLWFMLPQGYSALSTTAPAWKIVSIDGSGNCVANALWDITLYGTVAQAASAFSANKVVLVMHQWAPVTPLTGNTHSNTTLDGLSANSLINGDFVQGVGIPIKTRVVSGGGTASVVLSKAATSTLTGINLWDGQLVVAQEQTGAYFPAQIGNTGSAPVPTFVNGARQAWTLSASATWGAPTGVWKAGDELTLMITATGAFTTAWNAVYRNAPAWAAAANGQKALAKFVNVDGTNWQFIGGSAGFA